MFILKENIVNIKEELKIEIKNKYMIDYKQFLSWYNFGQVKIIRNIQTDTFELKISRPLINGTLKEDVKLTPFVNINNTFQFEEDGLKARYSFEDEVYYLRIPSGLLENKKFSNIKELYVGLLNEEGKYVFLHLMKFIFKTNPKRVHIKEGNIAKVKITKEITITLDKNEYPQIEFIFLELYYVPVKKNKNENIEKIADIYISRNSTKKEDDTLLDEGEIKTSSIKTGLKTKFIKEDSGEVLKIQEENIHNWPIKLGYNKIIDHSYYDYKKKKTYAGFSSYSKPGEIIPFNFFGSYKWIDTLDLFINFKSFSFLTTKEIKEPYLDILNGIVYLEIKNGEKEDMYVLRYFINSKNLEFIKENENISLRTLERLSNKKDY